MTELAEVRPHLSRKQRMILDFIRDHTREQGYPPAIRQICDEVGMTSTSSVHNQLHLLSDKGYIVREPGRQRAIRLIPGPREVGEVPNDIRDVVDDLVDAWHQLPARDVGDVSLAEFLQLRPSEQDAWVSEEVLPGRLHPFWRWLHRSLALPKGDGR